MNDEQSKIVISIQSIILGIILIFKTAFVIIVIPVLIITIILFVSGLIETKDYKNINASIIEVNHLSNDEDFEYEIKVEYIIDNIKYYHTFYQDSTYQIGETIPLKYNPENPNESLIDNQAFDIIGGIIVFTSLTLLFVSFFLLFIKSIQMLYLGLKKIIKYKNSPQEIGHEYIKEIRKEENKWK